MLNLNDESFQTNLYKQVREGRGGEEREGREGREGRGGRKQAEVEMKAEWRRRCRKSERGRSLSEVEGGYYLLSSRQSSHSRPDLGSF